MAIYDTMRLIEPDVSTITIQAEAFVKMKRRMAQLTAEQTGQPLETIIRDADRDRWFTAQEARDYGFVDYIAGTGAQ